MLEGISCLKLRKFEFEFEVILVNFSWTGSWSKLAWTTEAKAIYGANKLWISRFGPDYGASVQLSNQVAISQIELTLELPEFWTNWPTYYLARHSLAMSHRISILIYANDRSYREPRNPKISLPSDLYQKSSWRSKLTKKWNFGSIDPLGNSSVKNEKSFPTRCLKFRWFEQLANALQGPLGKTAGIQSLDSSGMAARSTIIPGVTRCHLALI